MRTRSSILGGSVGVNLIMANYEQDKGDYRATITLHPKRVDSYIGYEKKLRKALVVAHTALTTIYFDSKAAKQIIKCLKETERK